MESIRVGKPALYHEYAWQLLENFIEVVQGVASPFFTAADVAPSIVLIDESYQLPKPFELPWYENDPNVALLRGQTMNRKISGRQPILELSGIDAESTGHGRGGICWRMGCRVFSAQRDSRACRHSQLE